MKILVSFMTHLVQKYLPDPLIFAIPSGGGHWVVQGPLVMSAAKTIGANNG